MIPMSVPTAAPVGARVVSGTSSQERIRYSFDPSRLIEIVFIRPSTNRWTVAFTCPISSRYTLPVRAPLADSPATRHPTSCLAAAWVPMND